MDDQFHSKHFDGGRMHQYGNSFGSAMNQFRNGTGSGSGSGRRGGFAGNRFVDSIFLKYILQNRSSIIITASFSVAASTLIVSSIMYDSWQSSRRVYRPEKRRRFDYFRYIPPAHIFPLVLAFGTFSQSMILLAVQSTGLDNLFADGCLAASQITWTAAWIVGYVVLVFTTEAVYRSFTPSRLATKGRWNSLVCWVTIAAMLLLTWIPSKVKQRRSDRCLASLLQWTSRWSDIGLALTISLIVCYIISGTILSIRLWRTAKLDAHDRIAISSVVYYLAGTVVVLGFVLPFWVQGTFWRIPSNAAMLMGSVALNLFGIVYAFIYLSLRANGGNMMIGPGASAWEKASMKRLDSTGLAVAAQIAKPIITDEQKGLYYEKEDCLLADDSELEEERLMKEKSSKLEALNQAPIEQEPTSHSRKPSNYSLFPTRDSSRHTRRFILNFNNNHEDALVPPRPSYARHRRYSSDISAATVQIGLRLSNVAMPGAMQSHNSSTMSLPMSPIHPVRPIHSSFNNCTPSTAARSGSSRSDMISPTKLLNTAAASQVGGRIGRISPLSQNPLSQDKNSKISQENPRKDGQVEKSCTDKVLPPTPLSIPKSNSSFPNQPSPLARSDLAYPPPLQSSWPLPDRLSVLPSRTFKQPEHWI
ncbi:hypothetical protein AJ79_03031 [Helicocarpus griseus UAMH5409]|uniref:Uncharacterized protein n=1 Tax=Helicocarpus griseus UAMH5409 TaxID=1447875 RepID=A0A2B7XZP9_9EURO|nr:hypothetical protein AJ79_03031 [Helicocarpus griseus UAMH5409]